ncbi:MAG: HAD-IC family P-type ATPase, partial [Bacteroidetes bacterium]|nr:HAD-IC family P-type ATPase [Bacteroidota bacterium]
IDNKILGCFEIKNKYREGLNELVQNLKKEYSLTVLTGDNPSEKENLEYIFGTDSNLLFNQLPEDKLNYIESLKSYQKKVVMVGDGLNDAGALIASNVGITVSDSKNNFSPACDIIMDSSVLKKLHTFIRFAKTGKQIIIGSFIISIIYNIVGLYFAVQGTLSPVIAAILMPLSSISIVVFTTSMSSLAAKLYKLN